VGATRLGAPQARRKVATAKPQRGVNRAPLASLAVT